MTAMKKCMPAITNYLSDNEDDVNTDIDDNSNPSQVHTNYAEWKRLKKVSPNLKKTERSSNKPLGDISSGDEEWRCDDNEPLFKVVRNLAERETFRRRNEPLTKKSEDPSHFLLFSQMKRLKHFDCSFNDLCQVTKASWENLQPAENEELMGNIDIRVRDYNEVLSNFRVILLPESSSSMRVPAVPSTHPVVTSSLTTTPTTAPPSEGHVPARLHGLAGDANVYFAPDKSRRVTRHSYRSYTPSAGSHRVSTGLDYVAPALATTPIPTLSCGCRDCENDPVEDYRWDGQYCSAKCLVDDCRLTFTDWLTGRNLGNGDQVDNQDGIQDEDSDEVIICAPPSPARAPREAAEGLFASLQRGLAPPARHRPIDVDLDQEARINFFQAADSFLTGTSS